MIEIRVGKKINKLRKIRGLSQRELAEACGFLESDIKKVESAELSINIKDLSIITSILNIELRDFFAFDEKDGVEGMNNLLKIDNLIVGESYSNDELSTIFGCSTQGGMRVSNKNMTVTIITKVNGDNPYGDTLINKDGTFVYTGMGLIGDQIVTPTNQNGKVAYSETNGYTIHYFIAYSKNNYVYQGCAVNNGSFYFQEEVDQNGQLRKVVKFPLKIKNKL